MEGTIIYFPDSDISHDHTYYGNGCPNIQTSSIPDTWGGSEVACDIRIVQTYDGESQEIGTYYDGQAITAGSGETVTTSNTNAPDTFCPLGWQLPYGGTGGDYYDQSKSWLYLYTLYGYPSSSEPASRAARSYPFSEVLSGYMNGDVFRYFNAGRISYHYSITKSGGSYYDYALYLTAMVPGSQSAGARDRHPIRCDFDISILS